MNDTAIDLGFCYVCEDLGSCCVCERVGPSVCNVIATEWRAAIPGHGWGCVLCGLPRDGAVYVLCDDCIGPLNSDGLPTALFAPRFVCRGYPKSDGREPAEAAKARLMFYHDQQLHDLALPL